jgi:hypothetical protein
MVVSGLVTIALPVSGCWSVTPLEKGKAFLHDFDSIRFDSPTAFASPGKGKRGCACRGLPPLFLFA